jgi:hypothetical protein
MDKKYVLGAVLLFLVGSVSTTWAATVEYDYLGTGSGGYVDVTVGDWWFFNDHYNDEFGGMREFQRTGGDFQKDLMPNANGMFYGFCLDVTKRSLGNTGEILKLEDYYSADKASDIAQLIAGTVPDFRVAPSDAVALATQIALWEIVHETSGVYKVDEGHITFDDTWGYFGATALAQSYLDTYVGTGGPTVDNLYVLFGTGTFGHSQPLLVQTPIPAAVWLFGSALIGLVSFGSRRVS